MASMTEANFLQSLHSFVRRRPFKPFAIELVSGDRFVIDHPEAVAHRGTVAVFIDPGGGYKLFDNTAVSQLSDVPARRRRPT